MAKEFVSITEAAELAAVDRQTIWRWCDGEYKVFNTAQLVGGSAWIIERKEVIAYAEYYHSSEFEREEVE